MKFMALIFSPCARLPMCLRTPIRTRPPSVLEPLSIHFKSVLGEGTLSRVVCTNDNFSVRTYSTRGGTVYVHPKFNDWTYTRARSSKSIYFAGAQLHDRMAEFKCAMFI